MALFLAATGYEDMKSLGEYLQAERLARGVTLEDISTDTRISVNMLQAIEEGNTDLLPAPVLVKGFLRAYSKNIGLDPEAVILKYEDLIDEVDAREEALEKFHRRLRPKSSPKKRAALLFTVTLLLGLILLLWRSDRVPKKGSSPASQEPLPSMKVGQATSPGTRDSGLEGKQSAAPLQEPPGPSVIMSGPELESLRLRDQPSHTDETSAPHASVVSPVPDLGQAFLGPEPAFMNYALQAQVLEPTWLRITVDGRWWRTYMLQPGSQPAWRAESGFNLHIGNAAGVKLYLNGKPLKALGGSGRVVHLKLPDPSLLLTPDSAPTDQVNRP